MVNNTIIAKFASEDVSGGQEEDVVVVVDVGTIQMITACILLNPPVHRYCCIWPSAHLLCHTDSITFC